MNKQMHSAKLKTSAKTECYRLNSAIIFWYDVYSEKMDVKSVIYEIKRRFNGKNHIKSTNFEIKK